MAWKIGDGEMERLAKVKEKIAYVKPLSGAGNIQKGVSVFVQE
ncbi:MAG: hypothetical protein ABFR02_02205 [Campylobacterota bacterium]